MPTHANNNNNDTSLCCHLLSTKRNSSRSNRLSLGSELSLRLYETNNGDCGAGNNHHFLRAQQTCTKILFCHVCVTHALIQNFSDWFVWSRLSSAGTGMVNLSGSSRARCITLCCCRGKDPYIFPSVVTSCVRRLLSSDLTSLTPNYISEWIFPLAECSTLYHSSNLATSKVNVFFMYIKIFDSSHLPAVYFSLKVQ